jgi:hypothetical protein
MKSYNGATLVPDTQTYRNLALHRPAYASSRYDYNLTAQLVTDYRHQASAMGRGLIKLEWHPGSQRPRASHRQEPDHRSGPSGDQWLGADRAGRGEKSKRGMRRLVISCRGTSPYYKWDDSDPVSIRLSLLMRNDIALAGVSGQVMSRQFFGFFLILSRNSYRARCLSGTA